MNFVYGVIYIVQHESLYGRICWQEDCINANRYQDEC